MTSHRLSVLTLLKQGNQYTLQGFPVLSLPDQSRETKYFSLNPFLPNATNRCPLGCAYCVCHQDQNWHHHPEAFHEAIAPSNLLDQLLDHILATPQGVLGWPISLCDYSDPFIPAHQERVLTVLKAMTTRKMNNMVYITTKVHPGLQFLQQIKTIVEAFPLLRVTIFVSLSPLKPGYENASIAGRVQLLKDLVALDIPCCWYLRPLVADWFDEALMVFLARQLIPHVAHHVVLSGVVLSVEIEAILRSRGLVVPVWEHSQAGQKQLLLPTFEAKLRSLLRTVAADCGIDLGQVMGHRLCGTNGNYAYGCLLCGKQDRYCQLFQRQHYGEVVVAEGECSPNIAPNTPIPHASHYNDETLRDRLAE
ncbi:MAG: hypothetical protein AB4042_15930 [Leptolyngbyaceae cyanobacterium]